MKYYILYNDENRGPLSIEEMEEFGLNPKSRVWAPGWTEWKDADCVDEIQEYFAQQESKLKEAEKAAAAATQAQQTANNSCQNTGNGHNNNWQQPASDNSRHAQGQKQVNQPTAWATSVSGANTPGASSSEAPAVEWYIAVNNEEVGPVSENQLLSLGLNPNSLVWCDSLQNWTPACQVPALAHLLAYGRIHQSTVKSQQTTSKNTLTTPTNQETLLSGNCGNPWIMPVIGCILTLILIIMTLSSLGQWLTLSEKFRLIAVTFGVPIIICIAGIVSAILANIKLKAGNIISANRISGIATGFGGSATLIAVTSLIVYLVTR